MAGKKVTLKTIADDVGVSISVVSRVLNNKKKIVSITPQTKKRILESAIKHDLRMNSNIGIFIPDIIMDCDFIHYPFVAGVFSQAHKLDYGVFCSAFSDAITEADIPAFLSNRKVSGVIFISEISPVIASFLENNMIPYVLADISGKPETENCISIDYYGTTLALLDYLKENAYREYIFVNNVQGEPSAFEQIEFNCFKQFLHENRFKGDILYYRGGWDDYVQAISQKIKDSTPETVFITESRQFTIEILKLLAQQNKIVFQDVGLVGSNLLSEYTVPRLISVKYDFNKIGEDAIMMMHKILENKHKPVKKEIIAGEIIKQ